MKSELERIYACGVVGVTDKGADAHHKPRLNA